MVSNKTLILSPEQIEQKIARIAYEILENNFREKAIILAGIRGSGFAFAEKLHAYLSKISEIDFQLVKILINKKSPLDGEIHSDPRELDPTDKTIIIVDDVANTGKTLFYALKPLLNYRPKKLQVAVLVDRQHKAFPISADYVGLSLATTMQEHITVQLGENASVYLS